MSNYTDASLLIQEDFDLNETPLWDITEPVIKCQTIIIDSALENSFTQRMLDGKSFPIHFTSFVTQIANAGNTQSPVVSITRAFTRIKAAYISMFKRSYIYNSQRATDEEISRGLECQHLPHVKECILFYHPQFVCNESD